MKKYILILLFASILFLGQAPDVFADQTSVGGISVQTNSATNVYSNSATLNGYLQNPIYASQTSYVWFQWGTSTNYGNQTNQQTINNGGAFSQNLTNLFYNTTYHYRTVVQNNNQIIYGQDMSFTTNQNYYAATLSVSKKAINITRNNLTWSNSINACPSDILSFSILLQAGNQDLHNVFVKEILPANLIYNGNLLINATQNFSANPVFGINIGTIKANEIAIVSYQVRVAPASNFTFGTSTLTPQTTVLSDQTPLQTTSNSIIIDNTAVSGATTTNPTVISTGMTNNFLTESFFLPMLLIVLGSWLYFSGRIYTFADWLGTKM